MDPSVEETRGALVAQAVTVGPGKLLARVGFLTCSKRGSKTSSGTRMGTGGCSGQDWPVHRPEAIDGGGGMQGWTGVQSGSGVGGRRRLVVGIVVHRAGRNHQTVLSRG